MNENVRSTESRTEVAAPPAARQPPLNWEMCVVCGHGVEPGRQASRINHLGNTVNLCGPQCLRTFASDPAPYLGRLAGDARARLENRTGGRMNHLLGSPARQPVCDQTHTDGTNIRGILPTGNAPTCGEQTDSNQLMNNLTPAEKSILTGARDDGMIAFPQGPARAAEQILKVLKHLIRIGCVRYTRKKNWYRAWWITRKGRRLVQAIRTFQRESSARRSARGTEAARILKPHPLLYPTNNLCKPY